MTFILISSSLHYTSVLANDATTTTTASINHVTPGASANKQKEMRIKMKNQIKAPQTAMDPSSFNAANAQHVENTLTYLPLLGAPEPPLFESPHVVIPNALFISHLPPISRFQLNTQFGLLDTYPLGQLFTHVPFNKYKLNVHILQIPFTFHWQ